MSNYIRILQNIELDKCWTETRFKWLETSYPYFYFPEHLVDIVEIEEFLQIEEKRLPLFLGTQFGISPRIDTHFGDGKNGVLVAILTKSMLSGCVAGLKIAYYKDNKLKELSFLRA